MLVDSSKIGHTMPFTFARLEEIDVLVTEQEPSEELLTAAQSKDVTVRWE